MLSLAEMMAEEGCFLQCICYLALQASGVGCGRAGGASSPPEVVICRKSLKTRAKSKKI